MKKIILLFLFAIILFSACKKDGVERNSDRLIGRWNVESVAYVETENGKETEREQYSNLDLVWEFRSDGTATVNFDSDKETVRWTSTDDRLQIIRNDDDRRLDFKISSLTKNTIHIVFEDRAKVVDGITYTDAIEFNLRK
ncbi:lipocalin family protein [Pedobacter xixiisoli]|uniref:Lipocalin-like domain-containing protein n=1 Tax=Pedobacter xixiisoli TaxID=1476464 RepID=A0A285ZVU3_9SPHI|nr:lipocalin family protein [Pedobacter xixiisoli]SOD13762.1 Lipocalin-like domain-containing protein [Pedobacter xixiisoli]